MKDSVTPVREFDDGKVVGLTLFPSVVLHQQANTLGMRHIWLVEETAPAQEPCCRGDRVIHSLKDLEALLP